MNKIIDVSGGNGCLVYLLIGEEKTALVDCGMVYCANKLIENIKKELKERTLDYIFVTHTHYDHIGAIPYIKKEWSNIKIIGSEYGQYVLTRSGALKLIRELGNHSKKVYGDYKIEDYDDNDLKIDIVAKDGQEFQLGKMTVKAIETKGHTNCSMSFLVNDNTLFASESLGAITKNKAIYPAFLVSSTEAINSIKKCIDINPKYIYFSHYGFLEKGVREKFLRKSLSSIYNVRENFIKLYKDGFTQEQIVEDYKNKNYNQEVFDQPLKAFLLNTNNMVRVVLKEYEEELLNNK